MIKSNNEEKDILVVEEQIEQNVDMLKKTENQCSQSLVNVGKSEMEDQIWGLDRRQVTLKKGGDNINQR